MLTMTVAPTSGPARVAGFDVAREPLAARRASSVVFQEPVVDRSLTGLQNLEVHAELWGVARPEARRRIDEIVRAFALSGLVERAVGGYSGGERPRLQIAPAPVSEPRVLFLHEPTVRLDPLVPAQPLDPLASPRPRRPVAIL